MLRKEESKQPVSPRLNSQTDLRYLADEDIQQSLEAFMGGMPRYYPMLRYMMIDFAAYSVLDQLLQLHRLKEERKNIPVYFISPEWSAQLSGRVYRVSNSAADAKDESLRFACAPKEDSFATFFCERQDAIKELKTLSINETSRAYLASEIADFAIMHNLTTLVHNPIYLQWKKDCRNKLLEQQMIRLCQAPDVFREYLSHMESPTFSLGKRSAHLLALKRGYLLTLWEEDPERDGYLRRIDMEVPVEYGGDTLPPIDLLYRQDGSYQILKTDKLDTIDPSIDADRHKIYFFGALLNDALFLIHPLGKNSAPLFAPYFSFFYEQLKVKRIYISPHHYAVAKNTTPWIAATFMQHFAELAPSILNKKTITVDAKEVRSGSAPGYYDIDLEKIRLVPPQIVRAIQSDAPVLMDFSAQKIFIQRGQTNPEQGLMRSRLANLYGEKPTPTDLTELDRELRYARPPSAMHLSSSAVFTTQQKPEGTDGTYAYFFEHKEEEQKPSDFYTALGTSRDIAIKQLKHYRGDVLKTHLLHEWDELPGCVLFRLQSGKQIDQFRDHERHPYAYVYIADTGDLCFLDGFTKSEYEHTTVKIQDAKKFRHDCLLLMGDNSSYSLTRAQAVALIQENSGHDYLTRFLKNSYLLVGNTQLYYGRDKNKLEEVKIDDLITFTQKIAAIPRSRKGHRSLTDAQVHQWITQQGGHIPNAVDPSLQSINEDRRRQLRLLALKEIKSYLLEECNSILMLEDDSIPDVERKNFDKNTIYLCSKNDHTLVAYWIEEGQYVPHEIKAENQLVLKEYKADLVKGISTLDAHFSNMIALCSYISHIPAEIKATAGPLLENYQQAEKRWLDKKRQASSRYQIPLDNISFTKQCLLPDSDEKAQRERRLSRIDSPHIESSISTSLDKKEHVGESLFSSREGTTLTNANASFYHAYLQQEQIFTVYCATDKTYQAMVDHLAQHTTKPFFKDVLAEIRAISFTIWEPSSGSKYSLKIKHRYVPSTLSSHAYHLLAVDVVLNSLPRYQIIPDAAVQRSLLSKKEREDDRANLTWVQPQQPFQHLWGTFYYEQTALTISQCLKYQDTEPGYFAWLKVLLGPASAYEKQFAQAQYYYKSFELPYRSNQIDLWSEVKRSVQYLEDKAQWDLVLQRYWEITDLEWEKASDKVTALIAADKKKSSGLMKERQENLDRLKKKKDLNDRLKASLEAFHEESRNVVCSLENRLWVPEKGDEQALWKMYWDLFNNEQKNPDKKREWDDFRQKVMKARTAYSQTIPAEGLRDNKLTFINKRLTVAHGIALEQYMTGLTGTAGQLVKRYNNLVPSAVEAHYVIPYWEKLYKFLEQSCTEIIEHPMVKAYLKTGTSQLLVDYICKIEADYHKKSILLPSVERSMQARLERSQRQQQYYLAQLSHKSESEIQALVLAGNNMQVPHDDIIQRYHAEAKGWMTHYKARTLLPATYPLFKEEDQLNFVDAVCETGIGNIPQAYIADTYGNTFLHYTIARYQQALQGGRSKEVHAIYEIIKLLYDHGANARALNHQEKTPYQFAGINWKPDSTSGSSERKTLLAYWRLIQLELRSLLIHLQFSQTTCLLYADYSEETINTLQSFFKSIFVRLEGKWQRLQLMAEALENLYTSVEQLNEENLAKFIKDIANQNKKVHVGFSSSFVAINEALLSMVEDPSVVLIKTPVSPPTPSSPLSAAQSEKTRGDTKESSRIVPLTLSTSTRSSVDNESVLRLTQQKTGIFAAGMFMKQSTSPPLVSASASPSPRLSHLGTQDKESAPAVIDSVLLDGNRSSMDSHVENPNASFDHAQGQPPINKTIGSRGLS